MTTLLPFRDRREAARRLAVALSAYRGSRPVVLAIPRGAVPMARVIADALGGELDVVFVRKLGSRNNPQLAIGAVDERGYVMLDRIMADWTDADEAYLASEAERQLALIRERRRRFCGSRQGTPLLGRTVIVVDDGLATDAILVAALKSARAQNPAWLVCTAPMVSPQCQARVRRFADDVACLATPSPSDSVRQCFRNFETIDDATMVAALARPRGMHDSRHGDLAIMASGRPDA